MKGQPDVIKELNDALHAELTAIVQYMVQSELCGNWGYARLGNEIKKQAIEEMHHAEGLIERIVFLDAIPKVDVGIQPKVSENVKAILEDNLAAEKDAVRQYNRAVHVCQVNGDAGSKEMFEHMVQDEEEHADHLEAQLQSISDMGIANWLAQQMKAKE